MTAINQSKIAYDSPSDGLNDRFSPLMLDRTEAAELKNFIVNDRGILDKAEGYIKDGAPFPNDTDSFIRFLLNYKSGTTVDKLLMAALDDGNTNATYKVDFKETSGDGSYSYIGHTTGTASFTNGNTAVTGSGTAWTSHLKAGDKIKASAHADGVYAEIQSVNTDTSITLTANYTGATAAGVAYIARIITDKTAIPRGIVFNNKAIITNGADKMMTYNNTTVNLLTDSDCPRAKFIEPHKRRVFAASTSGNPSNIYWSLAGDETGWDSTGVEEVYPNDNGNIIGIKSFSDSLIVLKNNGNLYQVVGDFDQDAIGAPTYIRKIDTPDNIGVIAERSIAVHTDGLYFMTETGWFRLDARLFVQKISKGIDTLTSQLSFTLGPSSSKSYVFDTKTQWDTGTHSGTYATTSGTLKNFFDSDERSVGYMFSNNYSTAIGSDNTIHIVYNDVYPGLTGQDIKYAQIDIQGTVTTETIVTDDAAGTCDINVAPNGTVAVVYFQDALSSPLKYATRTGANTWSVETVATAGASSLLCLDFAADNTPRIATAISTNLIWYTKSSGSWVQRTIAAPTFGSGPFAGAADQLRMRISTNAYIVFSGNGILHAYTSNDDGVSWTTVEVFDTTKGYTIGTVEFGLNGSSQMVSCWVDNNAVKTRNHSTATTATIVSGTGTPRELLGFTMYDNQNYVWYYEGTSPSHVEKFLFEGSTTITNGVANTVHTTNYHDLRSGCTRNNGRTFAFICPSANSETYLARRVSFRGVYTSAEQSDATLTAWGTYEVSDQVNNGNTLTHEVALATSSPVSSYNSIVTGALISTDATKVFARNRITMVLAGFAHSEVGSVIMNYTGAGVDAKQPCAISFDSELYLAVAKTSDTANAQVIFLDSTGKFATLTYPVSAFCRYKNKLYAGKATNGDLLILRQGYKFDTSAYEASFISKEDFLDSIDLEKDIFKIYVLFEVKDTGSFTFDYRLNNFKNSNGEAWTSASIDQTDKGIAEILVGQKAHTIQCRVQNDNLDEQSSVIGFVVVYGYLNQR